MWDKDIHKEVVRKAPYSGKTPKQGDEVRIHYTGSRAPDGATFASSHQSADGKPYAFKLGVGAVMEAWDRVVATMKRGELSRFTVPEMYLHGGPPELLDRVPDDCDSVVYEIELVGVTSITDVFGDGGVIQTVVDDGEEYARPPKAGSEVQVGYELASCEGQVLDRKPAMDFKTGGPYPEGVLPGRVLDKALLSMKRGEVVTLRCRPQYAFGDAGSPALGVPAGAEVVARLELKEIYEVEDVGRKASWDTGRGRGIAVLR
ncbi:unnamed protein product [Prorocentrum cordatum]|uniref:peptidylprolyl isomerase n=1 Tax=Prorocentrum cordatum TaxID=2364126 RepID=A0ABN9T7Y0_9DINO|nr:unnamed protein product [Polarella glacialis]